MLLNVIYVRTIFTPQIYHYDTQVMYISFQRLTKCTLVYVQMLRMYVTILANEYSIQMYKCLKLVVITAQM